MKKALSILLIGVLTLGSGCAALDRIADNPLARQIAWNVAKVATDLGLQYAARELPEYADEITLAREALSLSYSIVFSPADGPGTLTAQQVAANVRNALAQQITDPDIVAQIEALIAQRLLGDPGTPAGNADYQAIAAALQALPD